MSTESTPSRHTNSNNSVNGSDGEISGVESEGDIPSVEERVSEFYEEYGDRAFIPLVESARSFNENEPEWKRGDESVVRSGGVKLREKYVEKCREEWEAEAPGEFESVVKGGVEQVDGVLQWGQAVEELLEGYVETKKTTIGLERGSPGDAEYAEFSVESETRWFPSYQKRYFAQLKGWMRELVGGERPSGGESVGEFENPEIVMLSPSGSAAPNGSLVAPVSHAKVLQDAWEPVYHTLRNTMRSMGFEMGEDWQFERRLEPHKGERGGGVNHGYVHEHIILVVDGEVCEEDFVPVLEKHVEECEIAGSEAHKVGEAVEVFEPDEVEDIAAYVSSYTGVKPEGLLERSVEYIAFAAAMDAGNMRIRSRSDTAKHAAVADACKQQYEDGEAGQDREHGEEVVRSVKRGFEFECACCGSPHGVEQEHETLAAARLSDDGGEVAVCDGGNDFDAKRRNELREAWADADAAASIGEVPKRRERRELIEEELERSPDASVTEVLGRLGLPPSCEELVAEVKAGYDRDNMVGFERAPEWRVTSVTVGDEEFPASAGGGVEMVHMVDVRSELASVLEIEDGERYRCQCGVAAYGETIVSHLGSHGISGVGSVEVCESLIEKEGVEITHSDGKSV